MATNTKIEWTDATWNPWRGCQHATLPDGTAHPGCLHCYAEAMSGRNHKTLGTWGSAALGGVRVVAAESYWKLPARWNREAEKAGVRRRVFCASLADVFEDWRGPVVDTDGNRMVVNASGALFHVREDWQPCYGERLLTLDDLRIRLFGVIDATPNLDWIILTKRPQNVREMWRYPQCECVECCPGKCKECAGLGEVDGEVCGYCRDGDCPVCDGRSKTRHNVHLLTSVSNQATADALIPPLLECRDLCPVLGLSCEPLLAPLHLYDVERDYLGDIGRPGGPTISHGIDWVIIGCESNGRRVGSLGAFITEYKWWDGCREIVYQCRAAGVPCFLKQTPINGRVSHDPAEWPAWARVREFPEVAHA